MSGWLQDTIFCHCVLDFILLDDNLFLEDLDGVQVTGRFLTAQDNLTKSTLAKHFQKLEIFKCLNENSQKFVQNVRVRES